jgi:rhamnulose-1-phosphate aldolase
MHPESIYHEIKEIAKFLKYKGWAERNAGNFSYRIQKSADSFDILISTAGSRFRDIAICPETYTVVVSPCQYTDGQLSQKGSPSSEYPTHSAIHDFFMRYHPDKKAVIHTHPTHLIAFSHLFYKSSPDTLSSFLSDMMPEVSMYIPDGIGFVELIAPGSDDLAKATINLLKKHDIVVWKKHGCIAVGETLWDAIDLIDILDKAAQISLLIHSAKKHECRCQCQCCCPIKNHAVGEKSSCDRRGEDTQC